MAQFTFEKLDVEEFVAKPETYHYANAHTKAGVSKQNKTNVLPVLSFFVVFIPLFPNIRGIKKCKFLYVTNSDQ